MITIQELLYNRGLSRKGDVKLVRHKMKGLDLYNLYREKREEFLLYQGSQERDVFRDVNYIVSFIGEEGTSSRFIGVFEIVGSRMVAEDHYDYDLEEVEDEFDDLKERVIINWTNPISWNQWISNAMEVIEIKPGLHYQTFTDFNNFILNYDELKEIVVNKYSDWKSSLSLVNGIYLITDSLTGRLYVGSAYGSSGIWGRWNEYINTNGHGNNKQLKELIEKDSDYAKNFRYSILAVLPSTISHREAIKLENLYKKKLGTNSFGLNSN
jgi:hypothetical protein